MGNFDPDAYRAAQNNRLAKKGTLILTVKVETPEQVDELMRWMYSKDKPMTSELVSMAWDSAVVPIAVAEAVGVLKNS
jgi:hypothetical protein